MLILKDNKAYFECPHCHKIAPLALIDIVTRVEPLYATLDEETGALDLTIVEKTTTQNWQEENWNLIGLACSKCFKPVAADNEDIINFCRKHADKDLLSWIKN